MRIAYISHFYPPTHNMGIEQNTHALASAMQAAGHTVAVVCAAYWDQGDDYWQGYTDDEWEGIPVRRFQINWQQADKPNQYLYDAPILGEHLRQFLIEFQPDVVHIASMYTLSMRAARITHELGIPTIMNLSDFWLICPRHTLMRHDGSVCDGQVAPTVCQDCLLSESRLYRMQQQILPQPLLDQLYSKLVKSPALVKSLPGLMGWGIDITERRQTIQAYLPYINRFVAPSEYIRDTILMAGLDMNVIVSHHGNRLNWLSEYQPRSPDGELHFGYMGQITPIKGLHLLVQAFVNNQFPDSVKLYIYGKLDADPNYTDRLRAMAQGNPNIHFVGPFMRPELPEVLKNIDVLVVPSIWPEVAGLVVQEAFAAKIPVLASNMGGLPEFVRFEAGGRTFAIDDATELTHIMAEVHKGGREYLQAMQANIPPVRTTEDEQRQLEAIYHDMIAQKSQQ